MLNAEGALAAGSLSQQDLETIKLLVSELTGCDYCVAAHTTLGRMTGLSPETLKQIRAGQATGDAKRDALVRFVQNLQQTGGTISAREFSAIKAAGYTDTQLAEISLAIALTIFTNTFNRINGHRRRFPTGQVTCNGVGVPTGRPLLGYGNSAEGLHYMDIGPLFSQLGQLSFLQALRLPFLRDGSLTRQARTSSLRFASVVIGLIVARISFVLHYLPRLRG